VLTALLLNVCGERGIKFRYIAELGPGMPDDAVLNRANQETALLLTTMPGIIRIRRVSE
jgi:hypothetical protein